MKKGSLLFLLLSLLACNSNKQDDKADIIDGNILLFIIENGSVDNYNDLVKKAGYVSEDTMQGPDFVRYSSKDPFNSQDELSSHVTNNRHVGFIRFQTGDERLFNKICRQFSKSGFVIIKASNGIEQLGKPNSNIEILVTTMKTEGRKHFSVNVAMRPENYPVNEK